MSTYSGSENLGTWIEKVDLLCRSIKEEDKTQKCCSGCTMNCGMPRYESTPNPINKEHVCRATYWIFDNSGNKYLINATGRHWDDALAKEIASRELYKAIVECRDALLKNENKTTD